MKLEELKKKIDASPDRRARVDERKREIRRALELEELRTSHKVTQEALAKTLGVSQARISKLERQQDARLSTLRSYIEALGGELEVNAVFDDEKIPLDVH